MLEKRFMILVLQALCTLLSAVVFKYTDSDMVAKLRDEMASFGDNIEKEI